MKIRVGLGSCGIAAGGNKVMEKLKHELENRNLNVAVEATGCVGMCFYEPLMDIIEGEEVYTYGNITPEMVDEIIESHIVNGQPIEKYIVSSSKKPYPILQKQVRIALKNCGIINPKK